MTTSIVILNWNGEKFLQQFLPTLIENTPKSDVEIIVADNASTDGSMEMMKEKFPLIRTVVLDENYGFAAGYNKALAQIESDYYILLNSDVEVSPFWLEPLVEYMNNHLEVAACQPKILSFVDKSLFEHAGASGGFIDKYGFPFCRGRIFGNAEKDNGQYENIVDVFWATGACLMIRSTAYWSVGGLDDDFFAHMEEIDLCWRLKSRGHRIVCVPQSTVYHVGGGTLNTESPHKVFLNFRNNLFLLYKNLPVKELDKILMWRILFDYLAAFQFVVKGKFKHAKSICKARREFKLNKNTFDQKRKENLLYATQCNFEEVYDGSVVFDFFVKGKRTYDKLT